jgi:hypothetical protein
MTNTIFSALVMNSWDCSSQALNGAKMKSHLYQHKKKLIFLSITVVYVILGACAELNTLIPRTGSKSGGLSTEEIIRGLKEALIVGAANSISATSAMDGFYGNPQIFIPFPPEAITVKNTLEQAGFSNLIRDFEKSLNRAAEEASNKALPVFKNAIIGMTITDAMSILRGSNNAATMYLKSKTEADLRSEFLPVIKAAIQTVEVTKYWNPIATAYNRIVALTGGSLVNPNLELYITQKSLDGLFLLIAQEEQKIRENPAARVSEILRKVFDTE